MNFKKHILTMTSSLCLALAMSVSASAQTGTVTADILNIRSSTSVSAEIISHATAGEELELLASDGDWFKVQLADGQTGYVSADYITPNASYFGVVTASSLIVRSSTSVDSKAITQIPYGSVVELLAYDGLWYKIKYNGGNTGYVSAEYISMDLSLAVTKPYTVVGYINATNLNIRKDTSVDSAVVTTLPKGTSVEILAYDGEWYKIKMSDGSEGYANAKYISLTPVSPSTASTTPKTDNSAPAPAPTDETLTLGEQIVQTAKKYIGAPYVWAAAGPNSFDCSGFTMYVMNMHGIKLPHQSGMQYSYGYSVPKSELIAGDLVFFSSSRTSGVAHVGIYIGDGNFIHASSGSAHAVTISPLSQNYYTTHYLGAKRVI